MTVFLVQVPAHSNTPEGLRVVVITTLLVVVQLEVEVYGLEILLEDLESVELREDVSGAEVQGVVSRKHGVSALGQYALSIAYDRPDVLYQAWLVRERMLQLVLCLADIQLSLPHVHQFFVGQLCHVH